MKEARLHLQVSGRVQGVFFRAATVEQAHRLGLSGWVRNRPDGTVEILAEGPREKLEMLALWAHRGPPAARVERVEEQWLPYTGEFSRFMMR